jgi:hypothetical protein
MAPSFVGLKMEMPYFPPNILSITIDHGDLFELPPVQGGG